MEIIQLIIEVLTGLTILIPLVLKLVEYVKKATQEKNWNNLIRLTMELMAAAETKFDDGADKKQWVIAMVQASADAINYPVTEKELGDLIDNLVKLTKKVNYTIDEIQDKIEEK